MAAILAEKTAVPMPMAHGAATGPGHGAAAGIRPYFGGRAPWYERFSRLHSEPPVNMPST
jgi:hypothetical protein